VHQVGGINIFAGFANPSRNLPAQVVAGRVEKGLGLPRKQALFEHLPGLVAWNVKGAVFQFPVALGAARPVPEPPPTRLVLFETGNDLETGNCEHDV
jgi:hypothetical protein